MHIVEQIGIKFSVMHFIAQSNTLLLHHAQSHNRCMKPGPSFTTKWNVHIALFSNTLLHSEGSEACHALPTICLLLQGVCLFFRCSCVTWLSQQLAPCGWEQTWSDYNMLVHKGKQNGWQFFCSAEAIRRFSLLIRYCMKTLNCPHTHTHTRTRTHTHTLL